MGLPKLKYFRYKRPYQTKWYYAYVDEDDNGISFSDNIRKADMLNVSEMNSAYRSIGVGEVTPEQMTAKEYELICVMES